MQQLSIGNVINVGIQVYRSHLKLYLKLSLIAHLWLLVPIYGWAKFYTTSALISCWTFGNLINQTESINVTRNRLARRMWSFLLLGILTFLIPLVLAFIFLIIFSLITGIIYTIISGILGINQPLNPNNIFENWLFAALIIPTAIIVYMSPLWYYLRLFVTDLTLVIENNLSPFQAIKQSWQLTKEFRKRLLFVILISFSISFPIIVLIWQIFGRLLGLIFYNFLRPYLALYSIRVTLLLIILSLATGIIIMPFWQSIKAVVYYDLRCRRENWDLKIQQVGMRDEG